MSNMDAYLKRRQQEQNAQKLQNAHSPAICNMCGLSGAKLYCATEQDNWTIWRKAYKTERKRYLCDKCVTIYSPSLNLLLEQKNKSRLREINIFDESGKLLPHTHKVQLELVPHYFPAYYLAELRLPVTYTRKTQLFDTIALTVIPYSGYNYWIDYFAEKYGYIYTCVHKRFPLKPIRLPHAILFKVHHDEQDRMRLSIDYNPTTKL